MCIRDSFCTENEKIVVFEAPFGGLGATYAVHLRLIGKLVGDFLLVIIERFSLGAFVLSQSTRLPDRQNLDSNTVPRAYASQSHGSNEFDVIVATIKR